MDAVGLYKSSAKHCRQPVEFLGDLKLDFQDYNKLKAIRSWDPTTPGLNCNSTAEKAVKEWAELQESISIYTLNISFN